MKNYLNRSTGRAAVRSVSQWLYEPRGAWQQKAALAFWHLLPLLPFLLLKRWVLDFSLLPESAFFEPVISISLFQTLAGWELIVLGVLVAVLAWFGDFGAGWTAWENGKIIRLVVGMTAAVLAWWFATLDVNLYFGQPHLVDRLLLLGLAGLVFWRPIFVLPFLIVLFPFNAQFHYPLGNHSIAQISLPGNLLFLFVAAFLAQVIARRPMSREWIFLVFCMVAASYFVPGLGKLQLGWAAHRHVYLMIFSSYSVGWLGWLPVEWINEIGRWMAVFDWPVVIVTIFIEVGALILLFRRWTALMWVGMFVLLNSMILVTSGIFFWTWIVINSVLFIMLWRFGDWPLFQVFSKEQFVLSLPLILLGSIIFNPFKLAWLDAPINYSYQLEATTAAGDRIVISTRSLAPYDTHFALGNFGHLDDRQQLGIVWGAVHNLELAGRLAAAQNTDEIWAIERAWGQNNFTAAEGERFDQFMRQVVGHLNEDVPKETWLSWIRAPRQVWTFHPQAADLNGIPARIERITVFQVVSYFDGVTYRVIRREPVREIDIK